MSVAEERCVVEWVGDEGGGVVELVGIFKNISFR